MSEAPRGSLNLFPEQQAQAAQIDELIKKGGPRLGPSILELLHAHCRDVPMPVLAVIDSLEHLANTSRPLGAGPAPMKQIIFCPLTAACECGRPRMCGARHLDEGEFADKPHHTHSCQTCGGSFRLQREHTVGVAFIPGFKNP